LRRIWRDEIESKNETKNEMKNERVKKREDEKSRKRFYENL
jgi:hypothetical protein